MKIFGYKLIKDTEYKELLKKERTLDCRVIDSKLSTFEDLSELKKVLMKEINTVEYKLRQIKATYHKLSKR